MNKTGSPETSEPVFLICGYLRKPHGVYGEVILEMDPGYPEPLQPGKVIYLGKAHQKVVVESLRTNDQTILIKFLGIETPEKVGEFRNQPVYIHKADLPVLPDGVYYSYQLIGLDIVDENAGLVGKLKDILQTGANDVYVVQAPDQTEILLPVISDVILKIDLDARVIHVHLPEWA